MQDLSYRKFENLEGQTKDLLFCAASQITFIDCRGPWREFSKPYAETSVSPCTYTGQFISWS
jgi:hypothetical protein